MAIGLLSMPVPEPWRGEVGAGLCQVMVPAGGQKSEGGREEGREKRREGGKEGGRKGGRGLPNPSTAMLDLIPLAAARAVLELQDSPVLTSLID